MKLYRCDIGTLPVCHDDVQHQWREEHLVRWFGDRDAVSFSELLEDETLEYITKIWLASALMSDVEQVQEFVKVCIGQILHDADMLHKQAWRFAEKFGADATLETPGLSEDLIGVYSVKPSPRRAAANAAVDMAIRVLRAPRHVSADTLVAEMLAVVYEVNQAREWRVDDRRVQLSQLELILRLRHEKDKNCDNDKE